MHCFGNEGEAALENVLHTQFKMALHLLHFRGNLEEKLSDLEISKANAQEYSRDVFGNPALLENGLVDAEASEPDQEFSIQFRAIEKQSFLVHHNLYYMPGSGRGYS